MSVFILGGGVAGLSAAHELAKFPQFEVHVFEKNAAFGGKASSYAGLTFPKKAGAPRYAAEHGFRLFPHFYRHLSETMKEIPFLADKQARVQRRQSGKIAKSAEPGVRLANDENNVYGNLIGSTEAAYARNGNVHKVQRPFPSNGVDFLRTVRELLSADNVVNDTDLAVYSWKLLKYMTSCSERREEEFERMTWQEYLGVGKGVYSTQFENLIRSIPRVLSAMRPDICSARSVGNSTLQLLFDFVGDGGLHVESVLAGPTQEVWLDPWKAHLKKTGRVHFWPASKLERVRFERGFITAAKIRTDRRESEDGSFKAPAAWAEEKGFLNVRDKRAYFIAALPLEVMQSVLGLREQSGATGSGKLVHQEMIDFDFSLQQVRRIERAVAPMVGIQFYLGRDVPICNGHVFYPDSPWALTSVSQAQFWEKLLPGDLSDYFGDIKGKGFDQHGEPQADIEIKGILSVIISDWNTPSEPRPEFDGSKAEGRPARDMNEAQLKREVWAQLKDALNAPGGRPRLTDYDLWQKAGTPKAGDKPSEYTRWLDGILKDAAYLDQHTKVDGKVEVFRGSTNEPAEHFTPLFVHPKGSYELRPDAELRIPNLLLASDYVRTHTDLATMEAANEAAKRAVLAILRRELPTSHGFPKLYPLTEGRLFQAAQELDRLLYVNAGKQPHIMDTPQLFALLAGGVAENVVQTGLSILGLRRKPPPDMARPQGPQSMAHVEVLVRALESAGNLTSEYLRRSR